MGDAQQGAILDGEAKASAINGPWSPACTTGIALFLRHGGPPPKALHQSGLTMGKMSVHGEPKFSEVQPRVFTDVFPSGAWPRDAVVDTHKQAGRQSTALTGASSRSCHVTKVGR